MLLSTVLRGLRTTAVGPTRCDAAQIGRKGINVQQLKKRVVQTVDAVRERIGRAPSSAPAKALPAPSSKAPEPAPQPAAKKGWF